MHTCPAEFKISPRARLQSNPLAIASCTAVFKSPSARLPSCTATFNPLPSQPHSLLSAPPTYAHACSGGGGCGTPGRGGGCETGLIGISHTGRGSIREAGLRYARTRERVQGWLQWDFFTHGYVPLRLTAVYPTPYTKVRFHLTAEFHRCVRPLC